ncbi:PR domain zinc finger protein 4-like [Saccostrea cucullata]|uniref:PR domain zinc finger protein 4-like n=1 Tax=Saccostrea cuccullata TaxID=36930 RepID=UPI002ED6C1AD
MTTAESNDSMTDTLSAINIDQLTSAAMGAFGHNVVGLYGQNEPASTHATVIPVPSSSTVMTSLPQTVPLMVSIGMGDKQNTTQGTLPPLKSLIRHTGLQSIRQLLSPITPPNPTSSIVSTTEQSQSSTIDGTSIKAIPESLPVDKSVLSGVFPPDSTANCHQTSALLSQLATLAQGNAQANQLEVSGIENADQLEGIDSSFLQNPNSNTDAQIAGLQSMINLILTNPSLQNSATCQALLNILNQSSGETTANPDMIPVSQSVDICHLLNSDGSVQPVHSSNVSLPAIPSVTQSVGSTIALASIVPSIPVCIPSTLSVISSSSSNQSTSAPSSVVTETSQSQPIDASQVTYLRQLINSQVSYADTATLGQTANQMISVKQDPSLGSIPNPTQSLLISGDQLEQFYAVTTSSDTMAVEGLLQSTSNTQVAVATMNYQDYAAIQNSLTNFLQSAADTDDVTLPSNLTIENINAAIQSEDLKVKKTSSTQDVDFSVDYCVTCDSSKCTCLSPVQYTHITDKVIPSRARLSMPGCLEIRLSKSSMSSQTPEGVYALKCLGAHTKFGPLIGKDITTLETEGLFPEWRVMADNDCHYITTDDEEQSNWLRFIRPAQNIVEQNLVVHQVGRSLFFFAKRDIREGEELLYWFSKEYSVICGFSLIPKPGSVNECPVCAKMFRKKQGLRQHLTDVHKEALCNPPEDNDLFSLKSKSRKQKSDPLELITCPFCKKVLASNSNLKKHLAVHKGERNFQCEFCHKSFRQKAHLESHMGIHKVEKLRCTFCDRTFNRDTDRKLHEKIHTKTGLFQCESCDKTFTKKQNYKRHILIHTGQKNFHCELCDKNYYTKYHLQRHKAKCRGGEKYPMYLEMEETVYNGNEILGVDNKNSL